MAIAVSPWAALRFRRSKRANGWVLLGISQSHYGEVIQLLFERRARLLKKAEQGAFVSLLFESPEVLAVQLALALPAPPGSKPIAVDVAGDRLLTKLLPSPPAQVCWQLKANEAEARLERLSGRETFAQVVAIWARTNGSLQPSLPPIQTVPQTTARVAAAGLDEEGFEADEWKEDVVKSPEEEAFEDVWELEESQHPETAAQQSIDHQFVEEHYPQPSSSQSFPSQPSHSKLSDPQQLGLEGESWAIAPSTQPPRRIQLPFEQPNVSMTAYASGANEPAQNLVISSKTDVGRRPLLPEESWAAVAALSEDHPVWEMPYPAHPGEQSKAEELNASYPEAQHPYQGREPQRASQAGPSAISTLARLANRVSESTHPLGDMVPSQALSPVSNASEDYGYVLSQGVAIWNGWRRANPHIRPTLRGAYLNNLNLAGADFHGVDLCFALLFRADLREANLSSAFLLGADLIRADLGGALLRRACLEGAYLSHANLAGADLTQANLRDVYWQGAILEGAILPNGQLFEVGYR